MLKTKLEIINLAAGIAEYIPYEKQLLLDAEKYIKRAEMYLAVGKSRHCLGCLIKAAKKYDKAQLNIASQSLMQPMLNSLSNAITSSLLNR